ncbi:alpha-mannosidase [Naasia lichenicola]|uniref:Alpha-mannosidase n=1 Tax=Naasia lichenicola TaxID=2565933 RepID=A0A4S4FGX8_9MICO|nr:alpha-mannosidase [Naasia lichenicola]THG29268.1 alpha-mannosidase [Naasia lichenicola]
MTEVSPAAADPASQPTETESNDAGLVSARLLSAEVANAENVPTEPTEVATSSSTTPADQSSTDQSPVSGGPTATPTAAPVGRRSAAPLSNAPSGFRPETVAPAPRPAATPDRTLHMIGNAHLDPVWLWPWQEGYQEARATFRSALDRMDEYPDFIFTCDQIVLLSWVEEQDPALFERIREQVAEGRWVNAGGWWVEPDCNMPMGESFVRQGLYGQRYLREKFGRMAEVGMNVDPFGHNAMLPQILRGQRMDSYMFLRPGRHESDLDSTLFWWQSPDGSRILGYRIPFEYCSPPGDVSWQTEKSIAQLDRGLGEAMVFYGVGNHGGGPTKANIDSIHRFDRMGSFGRMKMSSPREYFDEMLARGPQFLDALDVRTDDLQHHAPGCYSSHSGIKAWQRRAQFAVLNAERWAAVSALDSGVAYPREDLGRAWKQVLFNQFHDILPGSAIESAYDDARDQLGEAVAISKRIITRAHNLIAARIDIPMDVATQPVVVFNPHPWAIETDVELQYGVQQTGVHVVDAEGVPTVSQRVQSVATTDDKGRGAVAFRAELPAFGYRLYRLRPGTAANAPASSPLTATDTVLENEHLRVEIDPTTGWLSSLLVKATGVDLAAGTASDQHTQICDDPTDTWGHRVISYAWAGVPMSVDRILLRESGPLRARLRIERSWGRSTFVEELILGHDSRTLKVEATIDWREQAHLMKLRFPTALTAPTATYEIPFGELERPVDGAEEPAQSWVDLTGTAAGTPGGLTVIATGKHGWDVSPGDPAAHEAVNQHPSIGITAVRSPVYSWHDPRLLEADGIYTFQDQGVQRFRYELIPHAGDHRAARPGRRAIELGSPVRAQLEAFHEGPLAPIGSFADDGGDAVQLTAIKGSEDPSSSTSGETGGETGGADLIVRAVETRGEATEASIELPLVGRTLTATFGPYQIRTFRVPRDGEITELDLLELPLDD